MSQQTNSTTQMVSMNNTKLDKLMQDFSPMKTLVFFLIFCILCLIVIFAFIVPSVKEYKNTKAEYSRQNTATNKIMQLQDQKEKTLQNTTRKNMKILDALIKKFNKRDFIQYTSNYFSNVRLSKKSESSDENGFTIYELNVTGSLKSPNNFYEFLDGLNRYENIVKADFPINMIAKGDKINASFNIKVYNAK